MSNYNFAPTLDGLNNIDADLINTSNITVDNLVVTTDSQVPTITPANTSNLKIANTAFVQNAIAFASSGFATLAGTQTFTGINTFSNTTNFSQAKGASASGVISVKDTTSNQTLILNPNSTASALNPLVNAGELTFVASGATIDTATLTLTNWSSINMGLKITPTLCRLRAGANWFLADSTAGLTCNGALTCTSTINSGAITSTGTIVSNGYINYQSGSKNIYLGTAMGALQYGMYMNYSGTGISTDFGLIQVEHQGTAYRPLVLQPYGSSVGIGIQPTATLDVNGTAIVRTRLGINVSPAMAFDCDGVGQFRQNVSCLVAPTSANHLTTKTYVDTAIGTASLLSLNNTWTGTNTFNNSVLVKNTAGTSEYFEVKQATGSIAPNPTISRVSSSGGAYNTILSFTNTSGYTGRCIFTLPIAIYNTGTGAGGSGTTFSVSLTAVPYQILKNGASYVAPSTPYIVGGTLPDTKTLQLTGTGSYACEVYICEISFSFDITASTADTYAIQLNYSGSTTLPSSTNTYISCGSVSTFQAVSGTISMTSPSNTGYLAGNFYSSPLYNPSLTMGTDGYCALPRVINICPCGTIIQSLAKSAPYGFLLADGSTINIADYPDLFGLIQYDYGYGVYGVSFKLPNLNGAFLRGQGTQTYNTISYSGPNAGAFQQDQTLTIKQQGFYNFSTGSGRQCPARFNVNTDPVDTGISTFADRMGNEVRPFNFGVYYYIKY